LGLHCYAVSTHPDELVLEPPLKKSWIRLWVYWIFFTLHWKTEFAVKFTTVLNIFLPFRIFEKLALALKNRVFPGFTALNIYFLSLRIFEQFALALKNSLPWKFSTVLKYFLSFMIFEQLALSLKTVCPEFTVLNISFYHSGFLSNLRLPWKFSLYWNIFYHSGFLSNLRLPWKTEFPLKFSTVLNIYFISFQIFEQLVLALKNSCPKFTVMSIYFCHSGFLSNLHLPSKQSLPWNFSKQGGQPPPRLVRLCQHMFNRSQVATLLY